MACNMRIGELARKSGLTTKTIRYYELAGLLPPPPRTPSGYRDYGAGSFARLEFVKAARSIGLRLGEIREIIAFGEQGQPPCEHVADLIQARAADLSKRIAALEGMRKELLRLSRLAKDTGPREQEGAAVCHIIESVQRPA